MTLSAGYHDIRLEYFQDSGDGYVIFGWDPTGGTAYDYINGSVVVQADGVSGDSATRDDLVISNGTQSLVFGGRPRAQWNGAIAPSFTLAAPGAAAGLGDVTGDGNDDFAVLASGQLRIFTAGPDISGPVLAATITGGFHANMQISAAGDVDGDGVGDLLLKDVSGTFLIFGGAHLTGTVGLATLQTNDQAIELPDGVFRTIGDFNGDGAADLGAAVMIDSGRLNERSTLQHQVTAIYFGGDRGADDDTSVRESLAAAFAHAADLILEPGRASYVTPGTVAPQSLLFGAIGTFTIGDQSFARLAVGGPAGDALRVYSGNQLGPMQQDDVASAAARIAPELFQYQLATPKAPGVGPRHIPGINIATDANPLLRDSFGLSGESEDEALSGAVTLVDFNGDEERDLLVHGNLGSYVLLGPVDLNGVTDIGEEADILISADVGRPADRMGDVNGDGLTDLVFVRRDGVGGADAVITVLLGGYADGIELPRFIDRDWVEMINAAEDQNRVRVLTLAGLGAFAADGASFSVLNWNDDGFADVLIAPTTPVTVGFFGQVTGFIVSGHQLWGAEDGVPSFSTLAVFFPDNTPRITAAQAYTNAGIAAAAVAATDLRMSVAGDVNGDGLDDILFTDPGFIRFNPAALPPGTSLPNIGRAYLVTGRTSVDFISLATGSELIVEDFALGGIASALGDINNDGYDDFAVGRTEEGRASAGNVTTREGGLLIYTGKADFGPATVKLGSADAAITVRRDAAGSIPEGIVFKGALYATSGDFNADGKADLLVTEPTRTLTPVGSQTVLDQDERGTAYVLFSIAERGDNVLLTDANAALRGEFEFDRLGTLALQANIDINHDGLDDLLIGAAGADRVTTSLTPAAGKLFVIYGASTPPELPPGDQIVDLVNLTVTGSGDFLVDRGTGRAEMFQNDANGDGIIDTTDFTLNAGTSDRWYRFTTLGDGQPGSFIRITPGLRNTLVAPTDIEDDEVAVEPVETTGALSPADLVDTLQGALHVGDAFTQAGRLTAWSVFGGDFDDTVSRRATPIIFKLTADGRYEITGVGATRVVEAGIGQRFDFDLQSGSDGAGAGYFFGWKDGSAGADDAGAIGYELGGATVRWLGATQGAAGNVLVGKALTSVRNESKDYAITFDVVHGTVLEFDLGRFMEYVGNPDAIGQARLILDAPGAGAPLPAPINVYEIKSAAGKVFFVGSVEGKGTELWVTDGTSEGTHMVKDILPGASSSNPTNLTEVGGKLFFTANAGVGKFELWVSDGTQLGTTKVTDVDSYYAFNFTPLLGSSSLVATSEAGLSDGRPTVDYELGLRIVTEDGAAKTIKIALGLEAVRDNGTAAALASDINTFLVKALPGAGFATGAVVAFATEDGHIGLRSGDARIVQLRVDSATGIGFSKSQASQPSAALVAKAVAPAANAKGQISEDVVFQLAIERLGGKPAVLTLNLSSEATKNNTSLADLAADIDALLEAALPGVDLDKQAVQASLVTVREGALLAFTSTDASIASLEISKADALGFTEGQTSTRTIEVVAEKPDPTKGLTAGVVSLQIDAVVGDHTFTLPISLSFATLRNNTSLDLPANAGDPSVALVTDLRNAVSAALQAQSLSPTLIGIGVNGGRLELTTTDPSVSGLTVRSGEDLGFAADQQSARLNDSLFFVTEAGELWIADGDGAHALPGTAGMFPQFLTAAGGTLYFAAFDPATGTSALWQYAGGEGGPQKVPGAQPFVSPSGLVAVGSTLVFSAQPSTGSPDREVFKLQGGVFTRLSNIPSTGTNPNGFTSLANLVLFAAQDAPAGSTSVAGLHGRELWKVDLNALNATSAALVANIGQPDQDPSTISVWGATIPGNIVSSNPQQFTAVGDAVYFTADNGIGGRELWKSNGTGASLVLDLTVGAGSTSFGDFAAVGTGTAARLFFAANGSLYATDGTAVNTHKIANTDGIYPFAFEAVGGKLYFSAQGRLWIATEAGAVVMDKLIPPPLPLTVSVVEGEGDDQITDADRTNRAAYTTEVQIVGDPLAVDLTAAVRAALAKGDTRLTVRVENIGDDREVNLNLADSLKSGKTALEVIPRVQGLVADLYTEEGVLVAKGKAIIDLRNVEAGGFFLRVYNPTGEVAEDVDFQVAIDAPFQGWNHPESDRDRINGGDGDDILVGNDGLDRLKGESGRDVFIAENIEVRDFDLGEKIKLPELSELSLEIPRGTDALIAIPDANLRLALAEALGLPVTLDYNGNPLIHVPGGSERTDKPLTIGDTWSQRLFASNLAEMNELDASNRGITSVSGIEFAINLLTLNLAGNDLSDPPDEGLPVGADHGALAHLIPGTFDKGETIGFPYGMAELRYLAIDFNDDIVDLSALQELLNLRGLSFDGVQPAGILSEVAALTWPVADPEAPERGLDLLSLDHVGPTGLTPFLGFQIGAIYISEAGTVSFSAIAAAGNRFVPRRQRRTAGGQLDRRPAYCLLRQRLERLAPDRVVRPQRRAALRPGQRADAGRPRCGAAAGLLCAAVRAQRPQPAGRGRRRRSVRRPARLALPEPAQSADRRCAAAHAAVQARSPGSAEQFHRQHRGLDRSAPAG